MIELDLAGYQRLPGLINAHDHLEFSLFPRLGRGPYPNAAAWAEDIYRPHEPPIREHLQVPKRARLLWGGLKNLLSGVTTVCHHNPYHPVFDEDFPVRVVRKFGWAHSLRFSPDLAARFRATPADWPFIVHLAEGADAESAREIYRLSEAGALDSRTVLVHGVALDKDGLELVRKAGAHLVWCATSNLFTLGRTIDPSAADAIGTDSPLTCAGDMLDELCAARRLTRADLLPLVTAGPARALRLDSTLDFIAVREFGAPPDLVVIDGAIKLISPALAAQLPSLDGLHPIHVDGRPPALVGVDVPKLLEQTAPALGGDIRLAGRRVLS